MIIFDADDVGYLVKRFSIDDLRNEIKNAYKMLDGEISWRWRLVWEDFVSVYRLAIELQETTKPQTVLGGSKESIDSIKARIELSEYVGQYVQLKKVGKKYQGLCPFHADKKSKSFFVYPNQTWHCFGACNTGGTVIDFVMKYHNTDVKGAIEILTR